MLIFIDIIYQFLQYITFDKCEGKDTGNYTLINHFTLNTQCNLASIVPDPIDFLVSSNSKQPSINQLKILAGQFDPNGGNLT